MCKKCNSLKSLDNFEKSRHQCKKCRNVYKKQLNCRRGDGLRDYVLKKTYGITLIQYQEMSKEQDNKCAICEKINEFGAWNNKLVVDHCHKTNKIRQLLCDKCNKGLVNLMIILNYLLRHLNTLKNIKDKTIYGHFSVDI